MDGSGLDDTERALLSAWRVQQHPDPVERELLELHRHWQRHPARRPLLAAELLDTGELASRLLGVLLGSAVGEFAVLGRVGQRSTALLFVLEGLIRAHTAARSSGAGDPVTAALDGLRRWLHTRGVPWRDCGSAAPAPNGPLVEAPELRSRFSDDPTPLTALAKVTGGHPVGSRQHPINTSATATSVPLGAVAALWSDDPGVVHALGGDLAALTHGHPRGHQPGGVLGVATLWLLRGHDLETALRQGISGWQAARTELGAAVRLGRLSPAGFRPGPAHLARAGSSGLDSLAVAARVALACQDDFDSAITSAGVHDGDAASSAALCGQLIGALRGPTAIPAEWLDRLPITPLVERLATDAAREFGPHPDESAAWERRYPASDAVAPAAAGTDYRTGLTSAPRSAAARDRFRGAVLGGAIGEALGAQVAADSWAEIQDRHGPGGLTDYIPAGFPSGRLGSEAQLLLFCVEGTLRANIARRTTGLDDPIRHLQHAFQRWLHTQHLSWPRAAGEFLRETPEPDGWLVGQRALFQTRNPGRTMMRTLIAFAKGQRPMGTPAAPASDSADSGALLRAAPAALWSDDPAEVFDLGTRAAALTHGDPTALLAAGTLGYLVSRLMLGEDPPEAVAGALEQIAPHRGQQELSRRLGAALRSSADRLDPESLVRELGTGASAAEALAIGTCAVLATDADFDAALPLAANHSGNSAATAAVAGVLSGAARGAEAIPERWITQLELHAEIDELARDALREFGPQPPDWGERYPAT
ncbi:ADP-ribosylglycohydrolase family protein [Saccharopolyspora griseoalba]|uniref:ADP-ribosylglycohydrolase family protein n=1 Tax=Saccharopolyspora griseoalba TaxID=1431848 RepID=A0ABW2LKV8_9PSEU